MFPFPPSLAVLAEPFTPDAVVVVAADAFPVALVLGCFFVSDSFPGFFAPEVGVFVEVASWVVSLGSVCLS